MIEVYFDGWCPVCTGFRDRIGRLDWLGQITFRSMRDPGVAAETGVPAEELARRMYARDPQSGQLWAGVDAFAAVAARVPLLVPLWPLIRLSSVLGLGQRLYDYVAARRVIIPVGNCEDGSCSIHAPKK